MAGVGTCAFHRVRRPCGNLFEAIVEFLRRNVLEGDGRHRLTVAVAFAKFGLYGSQPIDRLGAWRAIPIGISQIKTARIDHIGRVLGVVLFRLAGVIAGIHHHDGHSYAPGSVGSLNGQGKSAWLEAVDRVQAAGEFAVDAVLLVGQDAALEIVIAVGGGERHFRFDDRAKEAGKRAADFVTGLVHELVQSRRHILWIGCCGVDQRGRGGRGGRGLLDVGIAAVRLHGQQTIVHAVSGPPLDSAQLGLDFGDRTHASARFLATAAQESVDVGRIVTANLVAGEHHQIRVGFANGLTDKADGIGEYVGAVLDVGHLQHAEAAVFAESQVRHASPV